VYDTDNGATCVIIRAENEVFLKDFFICVSYRPV